MKQLISINPSDCKMAVVSGNRVIDRKRLYKPIKEVGMVLNPILVLNGNDPIFDTTELRDFKDDHVITESERNEYKVVTEGQHRFSSCLLINDEYSKNLNTTDGVFIDSIDAVLYSSDEFNGMDIYKYIAQINENSKNWGNADYSNMASVIKSDDSLVKAINILINGLNVPLASVSRYFTYDAKGLKMLDITAYSTGKIDTIPNVFYRRGILLFKNLLEVGFDITYLRKRYLIGAIINKSKAEQGAVVKFIKMLMSLKGRKEDIKVIQKLSYDIATSTDGIYNKVEELCANVSVEEINLDLDDKSEDLFNENISYLESIVQEMLDAKSKTPKTPKKSKDKKKGKKVDSVDAII